MGGRGNLPSATCVRLLGNNISATYPFFSVPPPRYYFQFTGIVIHEFLHTFGAIHEQTRPDRDSFVRILWNNIDRSQRDPSRNFWRWSWEGQSAGAPDCRRRAAPNFDGCVYGRFEMERWTDLPYDYDSVMHYGNRA